MFVCRPFSSETTSNGTNDFLVTVTRRWQTRRDGLRTLQWLITLLLTVVTYETACDSVSAMSTRQLSGLLVPDAALDQFSTGTRDSKLSADYWLKRKLNGEDNPPNSISKTARLTSYWRWETHVTFLRAMNSIDLLLDHLCHCLRINLGRSLRERFAVDKLILHSDRTKNEKYASRQITTVLLCYIAAFRLCVGNVYPFDWRCSHARDTWVKYSSADCHECFSCMTSFILHPVRSSQIMGHINVRRLLFVR